MVGAALVAMTVASAGSAMAQGRDAPGVVTETAQLSGALRVRGAALAERITYWSRGPRGPMQSTAAIYLPPGPPPPGGWPIVAYAHGSVGIADQCAFTLRPREFYYGVTVAGPWVPRLPLRKTTTYFGLILAGLRATAEALPDALAFLHRVLA